MISRHRERRPSWRRSCGAVATVLVVLLSLVAMAPALGSAQMGSGPGSESPTPVSTCRTIDTPGNYVLTRAITTENSTCIEIDANDVTFDGNQYPITGNGSGVGIYVDGSSASPISNVTVTNATTTDWGRGIGYQDAVGGTVTRSVAAHGHIGIGLTDSTGVMVRNSTVTGNDFGFYFSGTNDSRVLDGAATLSRWGIVFEDDSADNTVSRTLSTDNSQWDVHSEGGSGENRISNLDVGSGVFSFASTNLRARGTHTGENVFLASPNATDGWNATGNFVEVDPVGEEAVDQVTASYTGNASASALSLWRIENGSWARLNANVDTRSNTVSARNVANGTLGLFARPDGPSVDPRTFDRAGDDRRPPPSQMNASTNAAGNETISLRQGDQCYPLAALGNGSQSVQEFYGYRTPYTAPNNPRGWYQAYGPEANELERANTSQLFVYRGSDGLSLVFLNGGRQNGSAGGGTVTANIAGLPRNGNWTVQDDHYHELDDTWAVSPGRSRARIEWVWNDGTRSDGAAYTGLARGDWQRITIDTAFNENSTRYPFPGWEGAPESNQVSEWIARSGNGRTYDLDMSQPVTLVRGSCAATGATDNASGQTSTTASTAQTSPATATEQRASPTRTDSVTASATGTSPATTTTVTASETPSATATTSDASSDSDAFSSLFDIANDGTLLGLGVLVVALVALALVVFRR